MGHFWYDLLMISIQSTEQEGREERGYNMIHVFSQILPKQFCSRTLVNVYNTEKLTTSLCLLPHYMLFAFGWKQTFDWWLCILLSPSWISSLLFLEDLAVSTRPEKLNVLVQNPFAVLWGNQTFQAFHMSSLLIQAFNKMLYFCSFAMARGKYCTILGQSSNMIWVQN